jgi:tetratricopeptide (TPR) repeat protein
VKLHRRPPDRHSSHPPRRGGPWLPALVAVSLACAPSLPASYQRSRAAAERAYVHGRYAEAAQHWQRAAREASRQRDRDEAAYRAAVSLERAGRYAQATRLYDDIARIPGHPRASRAAFARAKLEILHGNVHKGHHLLEYALRAHPDSGLAPAALRRYLRWLQRQEGTAAVLRYLSAAIRQLDATELAEHLHYAYAGALSASGKITKALDRYLYVARRFPYPHGALWDDALWHASQLQERLGNHRAAVGHLRRMLAQREPPSAPGTYQRPRYAQSQFRIAELYRDRLGDPDAAQREFLKVYTDHPDSRLRDDALWAAALVARDAGNQRGACAALQPLVRDLPDSRFAPCAPLLCPELSSPDARPCRSYIRRQIEQAKP